MNVRAGGWTWGGLAFATLLEVGVVGCATGAAADSADAGATGVDANGNVDSEVSVFDTGRPSSGDSGSTTISFTSDAGPDALLVGDATTGSGDGPAKAVDASGHDVTVAADTGTAPPQDATVHDTGSGAGCVIGGTSYVTGFANPSNPCEVCDPTMSTSGWTNAASGASCGSGNVCSAGACAPGCSIGGGVYTSGQTNPADLCQHCEPTFSTTTWSAILNGTSCGDGAVCQAGQCVDPFDASSCSGPPITTAQYDVFFAPGATTTVAGYYTLMARSQSCVDTACTAWTPVTTFKYVSGGSAGAYNPLGQVNLNSPPSILLQTNFIAGTSTSYKSTCPLTNPVSQANNVPSCTIGTFEVSPPDEPEPMTPVFSGVLTDSCLRLAATTTAGGLQYQWVLLAPL